MSGERAIEVTTQAMSTLATEIKGVEFSNQKEEELPEKKEITNNPLKGSSVFNKKEE